MQRVLQKQKNLKPGWGGILTEGFFAVRGTEGKEYLEFAQAF